MSQKGWTYSIVATEDRVFWRSAIKRLLGYFDLFRMRFCGEGKKA
jgi:hypothetical protein